MKRGVDMGAAMVGHDEELRCEAGARRNVPRRGKGVGDIVHEHGSGMGRMGLETIVYRHRKINDFHGSSRRETTSLGKGSDAGCLLSVFYPPFLMGPART